jgi:lysophospholipase L1-like esterase
MAVSQDGNNNVYVVWWTNRSGNWEVMFRASTDGGATFGDKINLSNSPDTQSQTAEIVAFGDSVFVSWWELNENVHPHTNESVLRVSTDAGQTFGSVINLGTNGTITTTTATPVLE